MGGKFALSNLQSVQIGLNSELSVWKFNALFQFLIMQCSGITTNWLVQQPVKCGKLNWLPFLLSATAFINDIIDLLHNEDSV